MKRVHQVEDAECPECGEVRACEVMSIVGSIDHPWIVRYLCSREHRFEVKFPKRKPMFPRKRR